MTVQYTIRVMGKVQGVYFRASTRDQARQLGIKGYVKNLPGGEVFIEVGGDEDKVRKLIEWAHSGPLMARVDSVELAQVEITELPEFEVRR